MHVNNKKIERNSSLEYYHMTCIGKKTYKLKRSTNVQNYILQEVQVNL